MSLYTKTGDGGETSLLDGTRVFKDDVRVAAYGTLDELNCILGWCRAVTDEAARLDPRLADLQNRLFCLGSELATPPSGEPPKDLCRIGPDDCRRLESWIDEAQQAVGSLNRFVLPGGTELASRLHIARTCCRRAERCIVSLHRHSPVRPEVMVFVNRLSDLLFAWARAVNHRFNRPEATWGLMT